MATWTRVTERTDRRDPFPFRRWSPKDLLMQLEYKRKRELKMTGRKTLPFAERGKVWNNYYYFKNHRQIHIGFEDICY